MDDGETGLAQTQYRIVVSTSPQSLAKGEYDQWDSEWHHTDSCYMIPYAGKELQSVKNYYWKVKVRDNHGRESEWSEPAAFSTGLMPGVAWQAQWIGAPWHDEGPSKIAGAGGRQLEPRDSPWLGKTFSSDKKVKEAHLLVSGLGWFEAYVNRQRVGDDYFAPNFTNYTDREDLEGYPIQIDRGVTGHKVMYMNYDVTDLIRKGDNRLEILLGNGFYDTSAVWVSSYGSPRAIAELHITYTDGSADVIPTDSTWEASRSAILLNGPFEGEIYDARNATPVQWEPVAMRNAPQGELCGQILDGDKITKCYAPVEIHPTGDKEFEVTFPEEISGWIRLKGINEKAGTDIEVKYISDQPLGVSRYICSGTGNEEYAPRFTWMVFSKAIVKGLSSLAPDNVTAEAVNTDVEATGCFTCSNPLFNRINEIWRRSQLDNMHGGVATDCPHRERGAYTGDGQVAMNTVMYNFDAAAFYTKWIDDMRLAQVPTTGYVPNGAPYQPGCGGGVAWGAAICTMPWEYYLHYGDRQILLNNYEAMKSYVAYMDTWRTPRGTMLSRRANRPGEDANYWLNLGDWVAPGELPANELVHTFYYWRCADYVARTAKVLGRTFDAAYYSAKAGAIRDAFHKAFYDPEKQTYGRFGGNVFALEMGIPDSCRAAVIKSLAHDIKANGNHIDTGIFGTQFLFEVLSKAGLHDLAYECMNQTTFPSYGYWIAQGATTTWEQWNGQNSRNHPMFGGGLTWFYRTLAGVRTLEDAPGFRRFAVEPVLHPAIGNVEYATMTPYGRVAVTIDHVAGKSLAMEVEVPVGSEAVVTIPAEFGGDTLTLPQGHHTIHR